MSSGNRQNRFYRKLIKAICFMILAVFLGLAQNMPKTSQKKQDPPVKSAEEKERERLQAEEDATDYTPVNVVRRAELTIAAKDAGFLPQTKELLGSKAEGETYSFTIFELDDGRIFMNGESMAFFPAEPAEVGNAKGWMLLPVSHKDCKDGGFPTVYDDENYPAIYKTQYDYQMKSFYSFYEDGVTSGKDMEGIILTEWSDLRVVFENVKTKYLFDTYSIVVQEDRSTYRKVDGTIVENYFEIPHSFFIDKEQTGGVITMTVK